MADENQTTSEVEWLRAEVAKLRAALALCHPIMEEEFGSFGPREPETEALNAVREALNG